MKTLDNNTFIVGGDRTAVIFKSASKTKVPKQSTPYLDKQGGDSDICKWGDDNLYPLNTLVKLKKSGTAVGGLEVLTSAHYGLGFKLHQMVETDTAINFQEKIPSKFPEIALFFRTTSFSNFMADIVSDYETFRVAFVEYLLSPDGGSIISVKRQKAVDCRFEVPINGVIQNVFINSDWERRKIENDIKVPCFSSEISIDEIKLYCQQKNITKFIIPVIDTLSFEKIYPSVGWHSSFKNGWLDVVLAVPAFKKAMFENQLNLKLVIHIADDYFAHRYGQSEWAEYEPDVKEKIRTDLIAAIDNNLKGNDAAGRSLISPFFRDQSGQMIKGIQIDEIPQNQANGEFLLDASAGNSEILFPMGVDPCLLGAGIPGGKNLSGSGSDKREAYTILCSRLPIKHAKTLQIFENIRDWNAWDPTLVGKFPNVNLTTLDKNPTGQQTVTN